MFEFAGKVALVTGAAQGIGRAIAHGLADEGADIAVVDLNLLQARQVADELITAGHRVLALKADVAKADQVRDAVGRVQATWGRVDILVNNAAILSTAPFRDLTETEWDEVLAVNLKGPFNTCRAVVDSMISQGGGRIINVASIAGKRGGGLLGTAAYSAAKAGVLGLTRALARELAPYQITVNSVVPGPVRTAMTSGISPEVEASILGVVPLGRFGQPEDIAAAVVYLASDRAAFVTGEALDVDGGVTMD